MEPFAGSLAVLLARPGEPGIETVNDKDPWLSNFWRAVAADPDEVARHADWPVNEADLHARHRWLVETAGEPEVGLSGEERVALAGLLGAERGAAVGRLVDRWDGSGFLERVKSDPEFYDAKRAGWWVWGQCLWIGSGWCSKPEWSGRFKLSEKRPFISNHSGAHGIHRPSVRRLTRQVPDLSGDAGAAGRGIHASRFEEKSGGLQAYVRALSERLRRVRVCCGDFERILGPAVTTCIGLTGVLLDPPYDNDLRATCYNHDGPEEETGVSVWWRAYRWAIDHGGDPLLRIALCGYEHPDAQFPPGWTCVAWKASGGYGRSERGKANARRERVWFSPHCLSAEQGSLF